MSRLSDFKLLCFDVYGTLIDWETGVLNGLQPLLDANKASFSREHLLNIYHECEAAKQAEDPSLPYDKLLTAIHPQVAEKLGLPKPSAEADAKFGQSVGQWPAFPDSVEALQRLGKFYKLTVLSNVDRESFTKSNAGPLAGVNFDAIFTAQDVGSYKPDQRNFDYMLREVDQKFGVKKEEVLQTAQSQFHDHHPARKHGIKSSWIYRPGAVMGNREDEIYDWKFATLKDMADALDKELAAGK